jgi:putative molybdopterin biosynthesis protein
VSGRFGHAPFLTDIPLDEAQTRWRTALDAAGVRNDAVEDVALDEGLDRVTAEPVFARLSSPHYHACAMDGIALAAAASRGASATAPVVLRLDLDAFVVDTGDPLPPGTDAVIMTEDLEPRGEGRVAIRAPVAPWTHIRPIGEDIVATEAIVPKRRRLAPADLAAIAAGGITEIRVVRLPRVAILTTGDELVDAGVARPPRGAIVDSNGVLLTAAVRRLGGVPVRFARLPDDPARLETALAEALASCDIAIVNAGSSAGRHDFTARVFARLGDVLVHGVAIRPGHPIVLALAHERAGRRVPLLGIPGYPVSAAICAELFLAPVVERMGRHAAPDSTTFEVTLTRKIFSPLGEDEFIRVVAARVGERVVAVPLRRGAGVITSLSRANAIVTISRFTEGAHAGTTLTARALRGRASIERTLLAVGSHDVAIDLLAGALADRGLELVSANVGSIAGLIALRAGATHLAGTHVLDAASGTYNTLAVRRYIPDTRVALIAFAQRSQGLIVAHGNPLGLRSLADVAARGARYVNRQRDAGTRMLLDALLARDGIPAASIAGYDRLEFTHLAVAALVAEGSADCGLGILAAARALGCDFVPIATEPYELAVLAAALNDPRIATLIATMRDAALRASIDALGGYDAARAGEVRVIEPAAASASATA